MRGGELWLRLWRGLHVVARPNLHITTTDGSCVSELGTSRLAAPALVA